MMFFEIFNWRQIILKLVSNFVKNHQKNFNFFQFFKNVKKGQRCLKNHYWRVKSIDFNKDAKIVKPWFKKFAKQRIERWLYTIEGIYKIYRIERILSPSILYFWHNSDETTSLILICCISSFFNILYQHFTAESLRLSQSRQKTSEDVKIRLFKKSSFFFLIF